MRMHSIAVLAASLAWTQLAGSQESSPIARTVAAARDGVVRMSYPARAGVCGDGDSFINFGRAFYSGSSHGFGSVTNRACAEGPVVVELTVTGGEVAQVSTTVGRRRTGTNLAVTDLGEVSPLAAAEYFLSILPQLERTGRSRTLLPVVLADGFDAAPRLLALARDANRAHETRRQAIHWIGILGDASTVAPLEALAKADGAGERNSPAGKLASSAVSALSFLPDFAGTDALIRLARSVDTPAAARRNAVFWLGHGGDERAHRAVRDIVDDAAAPLELRSHAIFALSTGSSAAGEVRWLSALIDRLQERKLREQVVFAFSQRQEPEATDALIRIARHDRDREVRKKALFWLGQKKDPRAGKAIADMVLQ